LLAERVTCLEEAIQLEEFRTRPVDESLLADFHWRLCGDLTPDWGGKWRAIEVTVGRLTPPSPHLSRNPMAISQETAFRGSRPGWGGRRQIRLRGSARFWR
jgi:hypothetical protein